MFKPDNTYVLCYKILLGLVLLIQLFAISIKISFNLTYDKGFQNIFLQVFPTFMCILDVILNFNMAYYEEQGQIMQERKKIIRRYLRSYFWIDLITSFTLIFNSMYENWIQMIFFFRMYQIFIISHEVDERFALSQRFSTTWTLIRLMAQIMITAHVAACIFHFLADNSSQGITWITKNNLQNQSVGGLYIKSLYFIIITMATVGYGDITPTNSDEIIFVIVVAICSCAQYAYTINTIGSIFLEKQQKQAAQK